MSNEKRPWGVGSSEWEDGEGPPTSRRSVEEVGAPSSRSVVPLALQLIDELRALGVDTIFGIPGGAISPIYAALLKRPDVRVINAKHETGAVFLAMGYALASGKPGVVLTTAGPGITNAITGIASAFYDSIPILIIAGEVPTTAFGRGALQESSSTGLDAVGLMRPITKMAATISRPDAGVAILRKAVATMTSGRKGPAFLALPLNIGAAHSSNNPVTGRATTTFEVDGAGCERCFDLLADAQSPLILAGAGARGERSRRFLTRLAEATGSPVAVSPKGKGVFPEDHPLYLGLFGFGGHESVIDYLTGGVDVLFVCGSGLNDFSTNSWSPLLKGTRAFLQSDIDSAQLGKNYPIDLGLLGPADVILERMLKDRTGCDRPARRGRLEGRAAPGGPPLAHRRAHHHRGHARDERAVPGGLGLHRGHGRAPQHGSPLPARARPRRLPHLPRVRLDGLVDRHRHRTPDGEPRAARLRHLR